ncbi:MAG: hydantoinase/oxoprolinase family protein [Gemmatimonadota bacterium]|nr:MAG: hydantoinase/oxoprolinase family protein [Gemmatimonadota bacterium]
MRLGVDVGGTFTDVVALGADGTVSVGKVRSAPGSVPPDLWAELKRTCGGSDAQRLLVHGTTVATNALLERTGGRVVLATTAGFEDLLWLRRQDRADLYDLSAHHPAPVVAREDVIGVAERATPDGVERALTQEEIERVVGLVGGHDPDAIVVSFLFSFRFPEHELRLATALRETYSDTPVVTSYEVLPVFREYERTSTAVAEAYLRPVVSGYMERLGNEATREGIEELRVMASNGGTMRVAQARVRAAALALSGPAGGVEGARLVGSAVGMSDLLTLDMGGTSADASVILGGQPLVQTAASVGGLALSLPQVLIETVGAGGGSIAWVDRGGALRVGPRSAGATPGPAAYGQGGGEATVTDAAVVLGWLGPEHTLAGKLTLDPSLAEQAVAKVARAAQLSLERCAQGIIEIATATMVRALRTVSVERGVDPRNMTLVAFGGAGPMFVCRMAETLGMRRALVPPHAGVLSALGLAAAPEKLEFVISLHRPALELDQGDLDRPFSELERDARQELPDATLMRFADCRYEGQGYELTVHVAGAGSAIARAFHRLHDERFGHADEERTVEVVNLRLVGARGGVSVQLRAGKAGQKGEISGSRANWDALTPGTKLIGPFMLDSVGATARIEEGWRGEIHASGAVILERL